MRDIILACVGIAIAIAGGVYLARLLYYKKFGVIAKAEVIEVNEIKHRTITFFGFKFFSYAKRTTAFRHTMRYELDGKEYEEQDRADYTQPMKVGSTHLILCDPKGPEKFKFEEDVQKHITIAAVLVIMALVFAGRFLFLK